MLYVNNISINLEKILKKQQNEKKCGLKLESPVRISTAIKVAFPKKVQVYSWGFINFYIKRNGHEKLGFYI